MILRLSSTLIVVSSLICLQATPLQAALVIDLDATIQNSVILDSNSQVTTWQDQSGNGNHATTVSGLGPVVYPGSNRFASRAPGLDFGSSESSRMVLMSGADADALYGNNSFSVFLAGTMRGTTAGGFNDLIGTTTIAGTGSAQGFFIRLNIVGELIFFTGVCMDLFRIGISAWEIPI